MPELGTVNLQVIRCLICGWRSYPPGKCTEADFDGAYALIRFLEMKPEQTFCVSRGTLMTVTEQMWQEIRESFTNG